MLTELSAVLGHTSPDASAAEIRRAVEEGNCLGKPTAATRKLSYQRLNELYGLGRSVPVFRLLRRLWGIATNAQPQLALLVALARDPLLRASAAPVLRLEVGQEFVRAEIEQALRVIVGDRLCDAVLEKVVRNCASSWAQAGHLTGRTFKKRVRVVPHPASATLAIAIAYLAGFRGEDLFASPWMRVLDADASAGRQLAFDAKRGGLLDLSISGEVVALRLDRLDPIFNPS